MSNTIRIKRRANGGGAGAPSTLANAELAFNEQTNILYYGTGTGGVGGSATAIIPIAGNGAFVDTSTDQTIGGTKTFSNTISGSVNGNAGTATKLATARDISISSDATGSASFDGSANADIALTLATVNSNVGTYTKLTVNAKGLVTAAAQATIADLGTSTGSYNMGGYNITNLAEPANAQDAATKYYVDSVAQGLDPKASCLVASTANITTLSGLLTIDGTTVAAGDRVLVKNQTLPAENGIYVAASGAWARSSDANTWAELVSAFTFIETGSTQADTSWVCTINQGGTIDVDPITWVQFGSAAAYTAGTGLTLSGNQFSITNTAVTAASYGNTNGQQTTTFTVNAQGQLTAAATYDINVDGGTF